MAAISYKGNLLFALNIIHLIKYIKAETQRWELKVNQFSVQKTFKEQERNKPDADLANVAKELSSKGRNTILTTKLPEICQTGEKNEDISFPWIKRKKTEN